MAESVRQKRITGRVMHEFKHGELKSGPGGKGGPVKSRRQAIAIALEEAGASKYESDRRRARTPKSRPLAAERQPLRVLLLRCAAEANKAAVQRSDSEGVHQIQFGGALGKPCDRNVVT